MTSAGVGGAAGRAANAAADSAAELPGTGGTTGRAAAVLSDSAALLLDAAALAAGDALAGVAAVALTRAGCSLGERGGEGSPVVAPSSSLGDKVLCICRTRESGGPRRVGEATLVGEPAAWAVPPALAGPDAAGLAAPGVLPL